jgi:type II restriction/modification system DNA methylase subunit YeeA
MNTNQLKKFAQGARRKLLSQVETKLDYVLNTDSAQLREKASQLRELRRELERSTQAQLIDKVAYTWFNRFMALRFMDANDYQPVDIRVVTPKDGYTQPELLDEAKQGNIPDDLPVNKQHIFDLLDGRINSANPQNEAYKELLIGACNHLNKVFPFLFERIDDFSELLMPDDLISEFSIVQDIRDGMTRDDCQEVEIIGWLYQFYISEKKDEVFASKSKVRKEDIPAATQLFTPRWIVEYMVQNTIGKLWLQNRSHSKLREHMPYFIESPSVKSENYLKVNSVEEITLLDQACGSGHILVYGFELLTRVYEEEGYNSSEIPQLIIENNLYGFEIDDRASQLAGLALMIKARRYQRRVFKKELNPNILCYNDLNLTTEEIQQTFAEIGVPLSGELLHDLTNMQQATNLGSLIVPHCKTEYLNKVLTEISSEDNLADIFFTPKLESIEESIKQLILLSKKYHCIVDNPPYMKSGAMNSDLSEFVKKDYPNSKVDLMACFMEAGLKMLLPYGFLGMINQHSWMFLSSYEKLRESLINNIFFDTLLHLGPRTFPEIGGEVVQNGSFTFWNTKYDEKGCYLRLVDDSSSELKRTKTLEAIQNPDCSWFYTANQKDFDKISSSPIGYWVSKGILRSFDSNEVLKKYCDLAKGMDSGKNDLFIRLWYECEKKNSKYDLDSPKGTFVNVTWVPYRKGGEFRKWYGNNDYVINWKNNGLKVKNFKKSNIRNERFYFRPCLSWTLLSSSFFGIRFFPQGGVFDANGSSLYSNSINKLYPILGLLSSKYTIEVFKVINPTLAFQKGNLEKIPISNSIFIDKIENEVSCLIEISRIEFDMKEISWDFVQNELVRVKAEDLEESYELYQQYWANKFFQLHKYEEELNHQFIEIYGLQEELTPDVLLKDITILREELDQKELKKRSDNYKSGWVLKNGEWILQHTTHNPQPELPFNAKEVFAQFMSYAVGCMFGRYSLDKEGLILANQGETTSDFVAKVQSEKFKVQGLSDLSFLPDDDNIIPVLDDEWFEDDIMGRFLEFLKVSFGKENFDKNLSFIEECLGKTIRKYFQKDFYTDHIKRYKKRPIYWMFSSPKGSFNVLIYMHRYSPDTLNNILNNYLREYQEKLKTRSEHLDHIIETGTTSEQNKARKEQDKLRITLLELKEYERDILYPLATERIPIDLDDGVLVNYNKFGEAIKRVPGLNDKKAKAKVKNFDWIDTGQIR